MDYPHIAVVILNYNSEKDLQICAEQIARQEGVHLSIILVDNASRPESLASIRSWLDAWRPEAVSGTQGVVRAWIEQNTERAAASGNVYLITNHENRGYSAGNNIGICLAEALGADAVLIANPDMRIENLNYLAELSQPLFADERNCITASRILGLDGKDQNPLRESTFWEELFWPRGYFKSIFKQISYVLPVLSQNPLAVPKVSGCCLMLSMEFLRATNNLDENVFLYCEEPILSARVKAAGGRIIYVPTVSAVHAHVKSEKGNAGKRMLLFINSRKYYLKTYSGYARWRLHLLFTSYSTLAFFNWIRSLKNK